MNEFDLDLLEFPALLGILSRYIASPLGADLLDTVGPSTDRETIDHALADAGESLEYLRQATGPQAAGRGAAIRLRLGGLPDVRAAAAKLRIEGAVLDATEIFELLTLLDRVDEIRSILVTVTERFPRLGERATRMGDFREVVRELEGKILPDGSVADNASVALHRIRRDMEKQKRLIQESLERFMRQHQEDGTLQEDFVTIRNDRFVVPIVAGQKRRVDGVIHSASGTGRTLFVEPLETIGLNNDLVRLGDDEMREVSRLLREWSDRLREKAPLVASSVRAVAELDLLFAKAEFGLAFDCTIPTVTGDTQRTLSLVKARHPVLEDILRRQRKKVVPISLVLDERTRIFLITGPNTGGKTVSLKTVGLLALMMQSGLPVPAASAELPIFDQVLADIGDNQSLAESLSSFSSHVTRVKAMEERATFESLILLDELGRATDPEEGGALGVAILDQFKMIGSITLASTHLLAMKVYGANTEAVLNGSVGFNEETLEPTYQLRLGAPGKSAALQIAQRLGMPKAILARAREAMSGRERDLSQFLEDLHRQLAENAGVAAELERREAVLRRREEELKKEFERREAAKIRELERRNEELVSKFEQQARRAIDEIAALSPERSPKAVERAQRLVSRTKREHVEEVSASLAPKAAPVAEQPAALAIAEGVRVKLKEIREPARVRRVINENRFEVEAGFLRMQVDRDDIVSVLPALGSGGAAQPSALPKNVRLDAGPKWDTSYRELNLIGQRADEAVDALDRFLDSAALASVDRIRVVHGFGMGVLRRAVAEHLSRNGHVEKFYAATPAEGGAGATIVELK